MRPRSPRAGALLLALGAGLLTPGAARAEEEVRIQLLEGAPKLRLSGRQLAIFDGESGARLAAVEDGRVLEVAPSGPRVVARDKGQALGQAARLLAEAKGGVKLDSGTYLGRVEIDLVAGKLRVINRLPLETYLLGIVGSEMSPEWPLEALKAQAVAARTYAMQRHMMMRAANKPYDLESTVISQVYKGAERIRPSVIQAVKETRGEVMSYRHDLVEALFHSTCGGETVSAERGFGRKVPYLAGEKCGYCQDSTRLRWELSLPLAKLAASLEGSRLAHGKLVSVERKSEGSPVLVKEKRGQRGLSARVVRQALGYTVLYSERFTAVTRGSTVQIRGRGFGHGVGMCQWGARGMALAGKDHQAILEHYYRGIRLKKLY